MVHLPELALELRRDACARRDLAVRVHRQWHELVDEADPVLARLPYGVELGGHLLAERALEVGELDDDDAGPVGPARRGAVEGNRPGAARVEALLVKALHLLVRHALAHRLGDGLGGRQARGARPPLGQALPDRDRDVLARGRQLDDELRELVALARRELVGVHAGQRALLLRGARPGVGAAAGGEQQEDGPEPHGPSVGRSDAELARDPLLERLVGLEVELTAVDVDRGSAHELEVVLQLAVLREPVLRGR